MVRELGWEQSGVEAIEKIGIEAFEDDIHGG